MELTFDIRGNLMPYEIIEITLDDFRELFVASFEAEASTRQALMENYERYLNEFRERLSHPFHQWINGSFASNRRNPKDIDLVTFIDYRDYETNLKIIEENFASRHARSKYGVDAYVVPDYPETNSKHIFTKSDKLYWRNLFSRTKVNRAKKQFGKGFLQLNFE